MSKIIKLSDRTHVLKRPARYIGSIVPVEQERFYLKDNQIIFGKITYVPAFIKIVREILDNSIDAIVKSGVGDTIKINIDNKKITIEDNSTGIPIINIHDEFGNEIDKLAPEAAWTELKTGSNFDDNTDAIQVGQNGEGSTLTNIFSKKFVGETWDGKKYFKLICKNNMNDIQTEIKDNKEGKTGTKVTFYPDLEKLHMNEIDQFYQNLIKFEILFLAATYPQINFKFNNKLIKIKSFKQLYKEFFKDEIIFAESENVFIGISTSEDGYRFLHFINGINVFNGGKVLEYAENKIIGALVEKIQKKYKNIKKSDVKNKITFHVHILSMPLPRFADQIKSECVNIISTNDPIGYQINEISKSKFIDKVYKSKDIIKPIIDLFKAKESLKEVKELEKEIKKIKPPAKYWPATKNFKYLIISEGDSAITSIINGVGRSNYGFYPIKGKTSNIIKNEAYIKKDEELKEITRILEIDFKNINNKLKYENIVIASDMDLDGNHIVSLLLTYFYKIIPQHLKDGKIYRFLTPLVVVYKNDKIIKFIFDFQELNDFLKNEYQNNMVLEYKKGLGSLSEEEWTILFERYMFEDLLLQLVIENESDIENLISWMGEEREFRKKIIEENINKFKLDLA